MPSTAPLITDVQTRQLADLGAGLRTRRKQLKVNATTAAEAAGLSRPTLYRIERGEPSVTFGAYAAAAAAVGLEFRLADPHAVPATDATGALPRQIVLADYPELKRLAWQLPGAKALTPQEALNLYERNWRHVDTAALTPRERALVQQLVAALGGGHLLV